jgi:hypothetical protein
MFNVLIMIRAYFIEAIGIWIRYVYKFVQMYNSNKYPPPTAEKSQDFSFWFKSSWYEIPNLDRISNTNLYRSFFLREQISTGLMLEKFTKNTKQGHKYTEPSNYID